MSCVDNLLKKAETEGLVPAINLPSDLYHIPQTEEQTDDNNTARSFNDFNDLQFHQLIPLDH